MIIVAVDPGVVGAIAFFNTGVSDSVDAFDLPNAAGVIDGRNLCALIEKYSPTQAVIEDVHAMPAQGVASTFKFGRAFGTAIGILEGLRLPVIYVSPSKWKRHYGLKGDGETSRRRALDLFPASAASFARKKDHHRAEAALIARWVFDRGNLAIPEAGASPRLMACAQTADV